VNNLYQVEATVGYIATSLRSMAEQGEDLVCSVKPDCEDFERGYEKGLRTAANYVWEILKIIEDNSRREEMFILEKTKLLAEARIYDDTKG